MIDRPYLEGEAVVVAWLTRVAVSRKLVAAAARTAERGVAEEAFGQLCEWTEAAGTHWALGVEASWSGPVAGARYGEWLRRQGRRLDAPAELRAAHEGFAAMGANGPYWRD